MEEKRKYQRYPIIHEMDQPVQLLLDGKNVPGVIIDLSAGGIALLTYSNIPLGTQISFAINLSGLKTKQLLGHVVWVLPKNEMWRIGIALTKIDPVDSRHINAMAVDYNECESKISLGAVDVCKNKCSYHELCQKPAKITAVKGNR